MELDCIRLNGTVSVLPEGTAEHGIVEWSWARASQLMISDWGSNCIEQFIRDHWRGSPSELPEIVRIFIDKLDTQFSRMRLRELPGPRSIADSRSLSIVGYHKPVAWQGDWEDFDLSAQPILIAAQYINSCIRARQPSWELDSATFKIINMFIHETFHLLITFLGHGASLTAPSMVTQGGDYGETLIFGGMIDYYTSLDTNGRPSSMNGTSWLITRRSGEYKAQEPLRELIAHLLHTQQLRYDAFRLTGVGAIQRDAIAMPDSRPQVQSRSLILVSTHLDSRLWSAGFYPY